MIAARAADDRSMTACHPPRLLPRFSRRFLRRSLPRLRPLLLAGLLPWLVACAARPPAAPGEPPPLPPEALEVYGRWRIDQARIEPIVDRREARLDFGRDGVLTGHTSCSTLRASYTLEGTRLKVGPIVTTRMQCGPLQMEQEDRILSALEIATSAKVRPDGLLELREVEGRGVLRGSRVKPE